MFGECEKDIKVQLNAVIIGMCLIFFRFVFRWLEFANSYHNIYGNSLLFYYSYGILGIYFVRFFVNLWRKLEG